MKNLLIAFLLFYSALAQADVVHSLRTNADGNITASVKGSDDSVTIAVSSCVTFEANGAFTGGVLLACKTGRSVTLVSDGGLTHASASEVASAAGLLPVGFRPTALVTNVFHHAATPNATFQVRVDPNGTLITQYFNWSGALRARIDTNGPVTISYITD